LRGKWRRSRASLYSDEDEIALRCHDAISPLAGRRRTGRRPRRKRRHSSQTVAAKLPGRTTRYSNEPCWRVEVHGCEQLAQSRRYAAAASWPAGDGTRDLVPSCRRPFISFISNGCEMVRFYLRPRQPPRHARRSRGDRGARADPTFSSTSNCSLIGGRAWRHLTALSLSLSLRHGSLDEASPLRQYGSQD